MGILVIIDKKLTGIVIKEENIRCSRQPFINLLRIFDKNAQNSFKNVYLFGELGVIMEIEEG